MFLCSLERRKNNTLRGCSRMDSCHRLKNNGYAFGGFFVFISFKFGLSLFVILCDFLMITESNHFPGSALFSVCFRIFTHVCGFSGVCPS